MIRQARFVSASYAPTSRCHSPSAMSVCDTSFTLAHDHSSHDTFPGCRPMTKLKLRLPPLRAMSAVENRRSVVRSHRATERLSLLENA